MPRLIPAPAAEFSRVEIRSGAPSALAAPDADGRPAAVRESRAALAPAGTAVAPRLCAGLPPEPRKGSPYARENAAPAKVTAWRRWP